MSESPNKDSAHEPQQDVRHGPANGVSTKGTYDTLFTVPWIEFNISAKPNHQALARNPAMQQLVGNTTSAALNGVADRVTERIVSSMRGIVEKTVREVIDNDIPHHVAASLEDTFKEYPVHVEPVAVTGFQRLTPRSFGGNSVSESAVTEVPTLPATGLTPGSGGEASPTRVSTPPDQKEEGAETVVETEAQKDNGFNIKTKRGEADILSALGNSNESIQQTEASLGSVDNTGDTTAIESGPAEFQTKAENEVEKQDQQATENGDDEQGSKDDLRSPQMSPEPESPVVPDILSASWIWFASGSPSQENKDTSGTLVFRKVAHVPMMVDSVIIDIAFPKAGQYTINANDVPVKTLDHEYGNRVKVRRLRATLERPADRVVIAVSLPLGDGAAEAPGGDTGEDPKTGEKAGLILAGALWMSKDFNGRIYRITTNRSWKTAVVASGEAGFTNADFKAGLGEVSVVGSYGVEPWGRFNGQSGPGSDQLPESDKTFLVSEMAQESTEHDKHSGGE